MYVWAVTFVTDTNRDEIKKTNAVAETFNDAYLSTQMAIPNAEIVGITKVGTLTNLDDSNWVEAIAKYLVRECTIDEATKLVAYVSDTMAEELTTKIWDVHHRRGV